MGPVSQVLSFAPRTGPPGGGVACWKLREECSGCPRGGVSALRSWASALASGGRGVDTQQVSLSLSQVASSL